jgi:hypothetical protein
MAKIDPRDPLVLLLIGYGFRNEDQISSLLTGTQPTLPPPGFLFFLGVGVGVGRLGV